LALWLCVLGDLDGARACLGAQGDLRERAQAALQELTALKAAGAGLAPASPAVRDHWGLADELRASSWKAAPQKLDPHAPWYGFCFCLRPLARALVGADGRWRGRAFEVLSLPEPPVAAPRRRGRRPGTRPTCAFCRQAGRTEAELYPPEGLTRTLRFENLKVRPPELSRRTAGAVPPSSVLSHRSSLRRL
jgi:hypothetical protein